MKAHPPATIRDARETDVPALAQLTGELGYATDSAQMLSRFQRVVEDREHHIFVAESADETVVGWVQVHFTRWLVSDPRGEVVGIVVRSAERGRGVGRLLMTAAEQWTKDRGGSLVALRTNIVRKETHAFYVRLGYVPIKTSLYFKKDL